MRVWLNQDFGEGFGQAAKSATACVLSVTRWLQEVSE